MELDTCKKCKEKDSCFAIKEIWSAGNIFGLARDTFNKIKICQLGYMLFSLSMKDIWNESDIKASKFLSRLIRERKE